jgi:hypothetical protein
MKDPAAIHRLPELLSARVRACARAEDYVAVAQNALEAGFDTPSTLRLAIEEPPFFTPDLERVFAEMLRECDIAEPSADSALINHAKIVAVAIVAGTLSPTFGAEQISEIFTVDHTPEGFRAWTMIAEGLWCEYCRESASQGHDSFESAVVAEAETILRAVV